MKITKTEFDGLFIIEPEIFNDERGVFIETFNKSKFEVETGVSVKFVQDNESTSKHGVIRGLHYQTGENAQDKLVRVTKGAVLDVVVDLRKDSLTFGKSFSIILTGSNKKQLFIPKGFAHGFSCLENNSIFNYKCSNYYNKESESGINPLDKKLNIDWLVAPRYMVISKKDMLLPFYKNK